MRTSRRKFIQSSAAMAGAAALSGSGTVAAQGGSAAAALRQYLQGNAFRYLALPPLADEPPTVTLAGPVAWSGPAATTLPTGVMYPIDGPLVGTPIRAHLRASLSGSPFVSGLPCFTLSRSYARLGQPRSTTSPTVLWFRTGARVVEVGGVGVNGAGAAIVQTLIVDGHLVAPNVLGNATAVTGGWATSAVRIDFGYRAVRDVWLQTSAFPAFVKIDSDDKLLPLPSAGPQLTVVGDSYLQGRSNAFGGGGAIAFEIAARLGIRAVALDAIGGTGYWNSGVDLGNFNDRRESHAADNSDIYLVMGGINDYGDMRNDPIRLVWPTRATYEQAVREYLLALRAACPNAVIVVTAPFSPIPSMSDASYVANFATNSSGLGDFLYKAAVHRSAVQSIAGPWVYIDVLMGGGWVNSSGATGDVTNLQWFTGGTPGPGTSPTHRPGHTRGGAGGAFGGIASVPVQTRGRYSQSPSVYAVGGSGEGLMLAAELDSAGQLAALRVVSPGVGYSDVPGGLPTVHVDGTFALDPATAGTPVLMTPVNSDGMYPLPSFTTAEVTRLNNAPQMLLPDTVHPSPRGIGYLSARLAKNIFDAVMAL